MAATFSQYHVSELVSDHVSDHVNGNVSGNVNDHVNERVSGQTSGSVSPYTSSHLSDQTKDHANAHVNTSLNEVQKSYSNTQARPYVDSTSPNKLSFLNASFNRDVSDGSHSTNNAQRFSHLLSIMPAGVVVIDKNGLVSLANQQAIILLGEPLVGQAWRDVIARVFAPQKDDGHEVSMTNGKKVKIDISPLTEEKGQLIVITDLTQTRELQSRVGHMQRLSSLGKMVASLAHQVRTPLASAILYAENLKSMRLQNNMASRFSEKLSLRLKELESQVNDMLLFAKSSDNQIVSSLPCLDIVKQCVAQTEAQLTQANIKLLIHNTSIAKESLNLHKEPAGHPYHILGNVTALTGALTNLITNAMQALEQQRADFVLTRTLAKEAFVPVITLSLSQQSVSEQNYCVFTVQDNGKGLEKNDVNRLFEPFYTTKSQGTGLGLAVVSTVAKTHKGFVKCGNTENSGAFFALYIPTYGAQASDTANDISKCVSNLSTKDSNAPNNSHINNSHTRSAS